MGHSEFKIFKGRLEEFAAIKQNIEAFVASGNISARSIGIEFIEHAKEIFISLGYSKEGPFAPVTLELIDFGKVDLNNTEALEQMMTSEAQKQQNVICHELCITDNGSFMMIFMSTK